MNREELRQLDEPALTEYLWRRLRLEPPIDPPVVDRFGPEPPEQFPSEASDESTESSFRPRLVAAIRQNLRRLADQQASSPEVIWDDPVTDQQIASLAFLASSLGAGELVSALYSLVCSWLMDKPSDGGEWAAGRFHILRTLAELQSDASLAGLWKSLWDQGPTSMRGLIIFAWARADADAALARLGELVETGDEIDLPATLWSLIQPEGPGVITLSKAAARLALSTRNALRQGLSDAGADTTVIRDFDLSAFPDGQ